MLFLSQIAASGNTNPLSLCLPPCLSEYSSIAHWFSYLCVCLSWLCASLCISVPLVVYIHTQICLCVSTCACVVCVCGGLFVCLWEDGVRFEAREATEPRAALKRRWTQTCNLFIHTNIHMQTPTQPPTRTHTNSHTLVFSTGEQGRLSRRL